MSKEQFEQEKNEILLLLKKGGFLRLSAVNLKLFKTYDAESNPLNYYNRCIFNNLIDEKLIIKEGGRFILNETNFIHFYQNN